MAFADTAATTTNMSEVLKRVYAPWLEKALNNSWPVLKRLQGKDQGVQFNGTALYWAVRYGRPLSKAGSESNGIPAATVSQTKQVYQTPSMQYSAIQWSDFYMEQAKSNKAVFAQEIMGEMETHKDAMMADVARQVMGDGTGIIATLRAASNGANPTLYLTVGQARKFEVGNYIVVLAGSTLSTTTHRGTSTTALRVTSVDLDNDTLTTTGDTLASTAAGDGIMVYDAHSSGTSLECIGLQQIANDTATLHGLDVATYPWWKGTVVNNGAEVNAQLDLSKLHKLIHHLSIRVDAKPTVLYCSHGVKRAFMALLQARQQYVDKMKVDGGFQVDAFTSDNGPIPIIADRWAPANTIIALSEPKLIWTQLGGKPGFMDKDGSVVHLKAGYPLYESYLRWYPQLGCKQRSCHGMLKYIEEAD